MTEESRHKSRSGLARIVNAATYSWAGLRAAFRHEAAFRQELTLAAILIPLAALLDVPLVHKALLIGSVLAVLVVELLNSAVEAVVDRVSLDEHELAKRSKDLGSAAVLVSLLGCALVWALTLADAFGGG